MNVLYKVLGLGKFKELSYTLPYKKIVDNCQSKTKQAQFLEASGNIISMRIVFSLKDLPLIIANEPVDKVELQVIEIEIERSSDFVPIIEAIKASVPYDTLLVFISNDKYLVYYNDYSFPSEINATDWLYEEELERLYVDGVYDYSIIDVENLGDLTNNLSNLYSYANTFNDICLRRLIDMLAIREEKWERKYTIKTLAKLYDSGEIYMLGDSMFVDRDQASLAFDYVNDYSGNRVLIDGRYDSSHRYTVDGITKEQVDHLWESFLTKKESIMREDDPDEDASCDFEE